VYCSKCGTALTEGAAYCGGCGAPAVGATPAPPVAPGPAAAPYVPPIQAGWTSQAPVGYAGFWLRLVAHIIDNFVLAIPLVTLVVFLILATGLSVVLQQLHPGESPEEVIAAIGVGFILLGAGVLVAANWLYYAIFESSAWQATPGKKALGLFVADLNGNRISFARASGRFFAKIISGLIPFAIGYIMAGFTAKKQALHDIIAGCLVLRKL
jgi:uncharacterized RDD family membrane protein YckC